MRWLAPLRLLNSPLWRRGPLSSKSPELGLLKLLRLFGLLNLCPGLSFPNEGVPRFGRGADVGAEEDRLQALRHRPATPLLRLSNPAESLTRMSAAMLLRLPPGFTADTERGGGSTEPSAAAVILAAGLATPSSPGGAPDELANPAEGGSPDLRMRPAVTLLRLLFGLTGDTALSRASTEPSGTTVILASGLAAPSTPGAGQK